MSDFLNKSEIICLDTEIFKSMVKELAMEIREDDQDPWIDDQETMRLLRISSKTTFQKYRDTGKIDFRRLSANSNESD